MDSAPSEHATSGSMPNRIRPAVLSILKRFFRTSSSQRRKLHSENSTISEPTRLQPEARTCEQTQTGEDAMPGSYQHAGGPEKGEPRMSTHRWLAFCLSVLLTLPAAALSPLPGVRESRGWTDRFLDPGITPGAMVSGTLQRKHSSRATDYRTSGLGRRDHFELSFLLLFAS